MSSTDPTFEPEVFNAARCFSDAQAWLASQTAGADTTVSPVNIGWYDQGIDPNKGSFALVDPDGQFADNVGDILRITGVDTSAAGVLWNQLTNPRPASLTNISTISSFYTNIAAGGLSLFTDPLVNAPVAKFITNASSILQGITVSNLPTLTTGVTYYVSFDARTDVPTAARGFFGEGALDRGPFPVLALTPSYQRVTMAYTPTGLGASAPVFGLTSQSPGNVGTYYVRNMQLSTFVGPYADGSMLGYYWASSADGSFTFHGAPAQGLRSCLVYVFGSTDLEQDLALAFRPWVSLTLPSEESLSVQVEVMARV